MEDFKWIGSIASIIGAFLVANMVYDVGYISFIIGAICWGYVGIVNKDKPLITMQGIFLMANTMGLYNAL